MPNNHEILQAIMFLYEEWKAQPNLSFPELLKDIRFRYSDRRADTPPPTDWEPIKRLISQAMRRYDFPEAQLKRDYQGTEYWDEGFRFDEEPEGLRLIYVNGLDLSEESMRRCRYRQEVCNDLVCQLYQAVTGEAPGYG